MYNRYIPQPDGSFRRNLVHEQAQKVGHQPQLSPAPAPPPQQAKPQYHEPIPSFLRQLIPQGFDTGDLIIVLLLLLIAGDSKESRGNALLTLALYFIL